jgi:dienelactone hydrolase
MGAYDLFKIGTAFMYFFYLSFLFLCLGFQGCQECQEDQKNQTNQLHKEAKHSDLTPNMLDDESDQPSKPYQVGTTTLSIESQGRRIPVQLWYPSTQNEMLIGIEQFEVSEHQNMLMSLLNSLDHECTRTQMNASLNGASWFSATPLPLIIFSHCHGCVRFSSFSTAQALAEQGYIVAAPDHVGDTLYDELNGNLSPISAELLQLRAKDLSKVLDVLLDEDFDLPVKLNIDVNKVGVFGHSLGAVTTGLVLQNDSRFTGGVAIAAPIENPLTPGVSIEKQHRPILYLVAVEDNSITEFGNTLIRQNYEKHPAEAWKLEVQDAGHWSFSDLCGLTTSFMPGCGVDTRQSKPGESMNYINNQRARKIAAAAVLQFFEYHFYGESNAKKQLDNGFNDSFVKSLYHGKIENEL